MTTPTLTDTRAGANGRLRAVPVRRAWNIPWIVVGVLLVAGSALGFTVLGGSEPGTPALALAKDVGAGEPLTADALTVVRVDGAGAVVLPATSRADVLGRVAIADLSAGTVLSPDLLSSESLIEAGAALVSVRLDPSAMPVPSLRKGAAVMVVRTPSAAAPSPDDALPTVWRATVFASSSSSSTASGDVVVVSLLVDALDAPGIAAAAATDQVRLVLVRSLDDVPPELLFSDVVASADAADAPATP